MNNRFCDEYIESMQTHILSLKDDKETHEYTGHKLCLDELEIKIRSLKNLHKLKVQEILKLI